jgi:hypothetical protein
MNITCVRHEARRQRYNFMTDPSGEQRAARLNILSRVCSVPVPADVLADISEPAIEMPIEIEEGDVETFCQKGTDRAFASAARAHQSNHRIALGLREMSRSATTRSPASCRAD